MELKAKLKSEIDKTVKYVFHLNGQVVEFSYIDNGSDKDIICVPCQTMCNMGCKFCHLTDHIGKVSLKNMLSFEIFEGVDYIYKDLQLGSRQLLISYMGCGEPMKNHLNVLASMLMAKEKYTNVRFGLATMLPVNTTADFISFTEGVMEHNLNVKLHLSLHFSDDVIRKQWMPSALDIDVSLKMLKIYAKTTDNPIEVHYTLMDGVNDSEEHLRLLGIRLGGNFLGTIKFMMFSEKDSLDVERSQKPAQAIAYMKETFDIESEYYEPPGNDIYASCGQFDIQYEKSKFVDIDKAD